MRKRTALLRKRLVLKADTIVVAAGQRPRREVVDVCGTPAPEVKFVGDCVKAANIREAVFAGYHAEWTYRR
jgi:hypothetical protein